MYQNLCTICDLRKLEVINLCDGCRLGIVEDVEFDLCLGNITAILLPKRKNIAEWIKFDCKNKIRIPWSQIERIGADTILVRFDGGPS